MSNLIRYMNDTEELHQTDMDSPEADIIRDRMDEYCHTLTDDEKKISQMWSVVLYHSEDIKETKQYLQTTRYHIESELCFLSKAFIVLTGLVLVTIVIVGVKFFGG